MSSQLLLLLKLSLLVLLYLFLLRVVRAVWAELSSPAPGDTHAPAPLPGAAPASSPLPAATGLGGGDSPGRGRGVPKSAPPTGAVAAAVPPAPVPSPVGALTGSSTSAEAGAGRLVVVSPPALAGRAVDVGPAGVLVGRGAGCDLVVEDSYVSQRHLRISEASPDSWWVEDLGSTNGTTIGAERVVAPRLVGRGEPVTLGGVVVEMR